MLNSTIPSKIEHNSKVSNIKDAYLKSKLEFLLNNWCAQKLNDDVVFFKHFNSNKRGVIYQLILSGNEYDGLYEFQVFGHDLTFDNLVLNNEVIMKIDTFSNFDLAEFEKTDVITTINFNEGISKFDSKIRPFLNKLSTYDIVTFTFKDGETIELNQRQLKETKFRKEFSNILKLQKFNINKIDFMEKRKVIVISKMDLGEREFKNQLLQLNLVTEEEYNLYTKKNIREKLNLYSEHKKVQII